MSTLDDETAGSAPRATSRRAKIWGWAGVAVLVVIASWFGWHFAQQPVRWAAVGYKITSPTEVQATFDVFIYEDIDVECHVRALSTSYAEVGLTSVKVLRSEGAQQRITVDFATTELATTALVEYCAPVE